jgi:protein ERP2
METASEEVHTSLRAVVDSQTHFRLKEVKGRIFAENLNSRINYWSLGQTIFTNQIKFKSFSMEKAAKLI